MDIAVIILGILCATIIVTAIIQSSRLSMWRTRAHEAVERAERAENALTSLSREQQRGAAVDDMRQVVEPLRGRIETLGSNMAAFIQEQRDADNTTRRNINDILAATRDVERQTRDLNRNISGNNNTQGRWGEVLLGNILAATGMVRGRDYDLQCVVAADETADTTRRPDAIVHLPGNRNVVIDAKTSITAYIKYLEAKTNEDKAQCLREHVASVRRQIDNLASKHYDTRVEGSPEFVILFMPNDDALATATAADATIYEYAYNKRVVPASPALLLAILQIVDQATTGDYTRRHSCTRRPSTNTRRHIGRWQSFKPGAGRMAVTKHTCHIRCAEVYYRTHTHSWRTWHCLASPPVTLYRQDWSAII